MKVLCVNTTAATGGAALSALSIHEALIERNIESTMLVARDRSSESARIVSIEEGKTRRLLNVLAYRVTGVEGCLNVGSWHNLEDYIKDCDIVHLHNVHGYYLPHSVLMNLLRKPTVWTLHDYRIATGGEGFPVNVTKPESHSPKFRYSSKRYPFEFVDRSRKRRSFYYELIDAFDPRLIAVSEPMRLRLIDMGLPDSKLITVPHGLFRDQVGPSDDALIEAKIRWRFPQDRKIILFAAAQIDNPVKGFSVFQEAISRLPRDRSWLACVAGAPESFASKALGSHDDHVRVLGPIRYSEIHSLYKACDIYVSPSDDETFGRTVIEAMANRAKVICSDIPVLRWVSGGYAHLFEPKKSEQLVQILRRLIAEDVDETESVAALIRSRFSESRMVNQYLEIYEDRVRTQV